jgi:hypothetical protein
VDRRIIDAHTEAGRYCAIAADNSAVVVAYDGPLATGGVYLARSGDGGASFDRSKIVLIDAAGHGTQDVAIVGQTIDVAYEDDDRAIRVGRSNDGGETFAVQIVANDADGAALLVSDGSLYLAYQRATPSGALFFRRSGDSGMTWSAPVEVSAWSSPAPWSALWAFDRSLSLQSVGATLQLSYYESQSRTEVTAHSSDAGGPWIVEPGQRGMAGGPLVATGEAMFLPMIEDTGGLFVGASSDAGATWTHRDFDVAGGAFGDNAVTDANDSTVTGVRLFVTDTTMYAIFNRGVFGDLPPRLGVARSTDWGVTWPAAETVTAFTSGDKDHFGTYYSTEFANIVRSTVPVPALLIAFFDGIYLRVLRSTDDGATWP